MKLACLVRLNFWAIGRLALGSSSLFFVPMLCRFNLRVCGVVVFGVKGKGSLREA